MGSEPTAKLSAPVNSYNETMVTSEVSLNKEMKLFMMLGTTVPSACGIAGENDDTFAATSGFGVLRHERAGANVISETQLADVAFDNHLRRLG